jgi:hypothetical protein
MGMYSDWIARNPGKSDKQAVNVEFVLKEIDISLQSILKQVYPVGSIYLTVNNINPMAWIPGTTWEVWGSGRVPVGVDTNDTSFNTVEKTGGAKTHTLTIDEMPSHNHTSPDHGAHQYNDRSGGSLSTGDSDTHNIRINPTGGGQAHNNLQPYITCYMFKRIA